MPLDLARLLPQLQKVELFSGLSPEQITEIARQFSERILDRGQTLAVKAEAEQNLFIILEGGVFVRSLGPQGETRGEKLAAGEFFNEETLLFGQPDGAIITTDEPTRLIFLDSEAFDALLADHPEIKPALARTPETRHLLRKRQFEWLDPAEVIYLLARKSEAILAIGLIGPLLVFLIAAILIVWVLGLDPQSSIWTGGLICTSGLALFGILWGLWAWIDWGNDYYIVTDQRVVWVEKVIWLYESRDEAPLNTVLAVNVTTSFLGRILNFGNVIVRTFTGEIVFRNLREYDRMVDLINEYRQRLQRRSEKLEKREIDRALQQRLGLAEPAAAPAAVAAPAKPARPPGFLTRNFSNLFTMRFEQGNVITFRKYWPTLLGKIWVPSLLIVLVVFGTGFLVQRLVTGSAGQSSFSILALLDFLLLVFAIGWWVYRYVDWRNDIYQVSDKFIFDIERKPLGTEVKKSAPLESILSLEHERLGILGYLLNYGKVIINVGETKFFFHSVHDPARVQQDIFTRIHGLRRQKEAAEAARERKRLVDVLGIYDQRSREARSREDYELYEDEI